MSAVADEPVRRAVDDRVQSPTIYRCGACGGLVHPADPPSSLLAFCRRCGRYTDATVDGG
ncbi:MAG TPA: hypothetical protein VE990_12185 [Acidimicrobiales bacterium]|nr:hypothetical protein [Acidimicrobiales bacterium]